MARGDRRIWLIAIALAALGAACSSADDRLATSRPVETKPAAAVAATAPVPPAIAAAVAAPNAPGASAPAAPPSTAPSRVVVEQPWAPFAQAGGAITVVHPSSRVERVGFHESNHEGAQHLDVLPTAAAPFVTETRDRGTGGQTAADIVVDPASEIRSPVSGTVKRGGNYVLYCKYSDGYLVISPDADPAMEVKLLHIQGVSVNAGERVVAGQTVVASHATQLPFESDVDEFTADPSWPHVHLEVVDPRIRNRPNPGSGGGCS